MKTEIQRTSVIVNGKHIVKYRAKVTCWTFKYGILGYRIPAIKLLDELDPKVSFMTQKTFDDYIGNLPVDSLSRAQKIIDLLLEAKERIDASRDAAKQEKLTKQTTFFRYPREEK